MCRGVPDLADEVVRAAKREERSGRDVGESSAVVLRGGRGGARLGRTVDLEEGQVRNLEELTIES